MGKCTACGGKGYQFTHRGSEALPSVMLRRICLKCGGSGTVARRSFFKAEANPKNYYWNQREGLKLFMSAYATQLFCFIVVGGLHVYTYVVIPGNTLIKFSGPPNLDARLHAFELLYSISSLLAVFPLLLFLYSLSDCVYAYIKLSVDRGQWQWKVGDYFAEANIAIPFLFSPFLFLFGAVIGFSIGHRVLQEGLLATWFCAGAGGLTLLVCVSLLVVVIRLGSWAVGRDANLAVPVIVLAIFVILSVVWVAVCNYFFHQFAPLA